MKATHTITYDYTELAVVEIDFKRAEKIIKDMVNFWSGAESRLSENGGCYLKSWLKMLGMFILTRRRAPRDGDEGWAILDGQHGITLKEWESWEPDEDQIELS